MIKINKVNNSLTVEGVDNVFYPNNGDNSYPLNSLIVVIDDSNMATFRSVATNDVLFSGLIEDITINGEAVTKDNIITKFDAVSNSTSTGGGGGSVDAYTKTESDAKYATKDELTAVETVANDADTKVDALTPRVEGIETSMNNKQDLLVSGTNIKTINNQSILGEGNLEISVDVDLTDYYTKEETDTKFASKDELTAVETVANGADLKADAATSRVESVETSLGNKQDTLVSGTNIKTINSQSIIGSGDLAISGVSDEQAQEIAKIPTIETELAQKANVSDVPTVQTGSVGTNKNYIYSDSNASNTKVISNVTLIRQFDSIRMQKYYWIPDDSTSANYVTDILSSATTSKAGVMSAADKTKLDSIPETIPSQSEIDGIAANVSALESDMANKQPTLVSGTNIKTINNESLLGEGNIEVAKKTDIPNTDNFATKDELNNKQDTLVSGTNIKTVNSQSILGSGDLAISGVSEEQAQEIAKIPTLETELAQKANVSDVPTVQTGKVGTNKNYIYSEDNTRNYKSVMSKLEVGVNDADDVILAYHLWNSSSTTSFFFPKATTSKAGIITAADKTKLDSISNEWTGTQSEFDALTTKDNNTIYYVTE